MRQYLTEGVKGAFPFIVDRSKTPVAESRPNGNSFHRIPGRFSVCDCINGNNRRYGRRVWEKNLQPGSVLQESIKRNAAFGLLEHPKDGIVTLLSPISHHVTGAQMVETVDAQGNKVYEVTGEIALLDTEEGKKLKALIDGGYNPLVSSRGYGSLAKAADGVDEVQEDYVCEGWDVVIKPSFESAELLPDRSTTTAQMAPPYAPNPQAESADLKGTPEHKLHEQRACPASGTLLQPCLEGKNLKETSPSSGVVLKPISETKTSTNTMELNEIKSRIDSLRNVDPAKPVRFAESMTQVEELHQHVAEWAAADPKRSWDAQKLHATLESIAEGFTETVKAPAKEAKRLSEQNNKLMKVINAVASTAVTYKKKLGESLKADGSRIKMIEELTRRGQGWQRIAESRKQKYVTMEADFNTACEALDLMAKRYHEDVTELGRRLITLEFKEKAQTSEIQKALKESTRLRHIVAIREKLEGKKPGREAIKNEKQKGAGSPDAECVAKEPGPVVSESTVNDILAHIRERFIDERVSGFAKNGVQHAPVSREEAEARWQKVEPDFRRALQVMDEPTRSRLGLGPNESLRVSTSDVLKAAKLSESQVLKNDRVDLSVKTVNESVELVRRLSPAPAK